MFHNTLENLEKLLVPSRAKPAWIIGPSGVHALPLAAGINVGGHSTWHSFSFFSLAKVLTFLPGFRNFAWAPR